ncbi:hypothetical protein [Sinomicrobium sp. M5D2P9]
MKTSVHTPENKEETLTGHQARNSGEEETEASHYLVSRISELSVFSLLWG